MRTVLDRVGKWVGPLCLTLGIVGTIEAAPILDDCSTASNFSIPGGITGSSFKANGDGTVTFTRITANTEAIVDWMNGGSKIPLATNSQVTITPTTMQNGAYYNVGIIYYNGNNYVTQVSAIGDTNSTAVKTFDAATLTGAPAAGTADRYFVRFRVDPWDSTSLPAANFTEISANAVPEPVSMSVIGLAGLALLRRRSR